MFWTWGWLHRMLAHYAHLLSCLAGWLIWVFIRTWKLFICILVDMCGDRILAIEIFFLDYRSCAYLSPSPHCIYNFRNISVLLCMRRSKEIYLVLLCIYILLDLIEYVMISSAFDWHWEFCFKNTIDESLLFPGPNWRFACLASKGLKIMPGVCCVSLGLNNGERTASNFLHKKILDHRMVSLYHLVQWYSSFRSAGNYGHRLCQCKTWSLN